MSIRNKNSQSLSRSKKIGDNPIVDAMHNTDGLNIGDLVESEDTDCRVS
uniref:Uncharacterized protein n=1 Tax=Onchocerca volvulus TaxID=6282 RepID=A0A8R1XW18_ONCVO